MEWIWDDGEPTWAAYDQKSSPGFVKWIQSEGHIFWIYGKPGAGKSTLMKQLTQSKQTFDLMPRWPKPVITVSFFFYELGQHQERQFKSLLMAILFALLQTFHDTDPRAVSSIMNTLEPQVSRNPRDQKQSIWKDEKLQEALRQTLIVCQISASLLLFVDGMDECEGDYRGQLDFLKTWIESSTSSKLSIKACIASRDETEIRLRLSMYPSLPVHSFTKANILTYVTRRLRAAWEMMSRQPDCTTVTFDQALIDTLVEKAEGVFLWVDLVVTQLTLSIEEERTVKELWMQLNDMPEGLRDLYSRIVDKIPQRLLHDTANFLRMYNHSIHDWGTGPLVIGVHEFTLWEFYAAVEDPSTAISCKAHFEKGFKEENNHSQQRLCAIMKRRIQRVCKGLIHVEETNDLPNAGVNLLHRTVKEFIIKDDSFQLLLASADQRLIRDPEFLLMGMFLRLLKIDPFYEDAWINWVSPENRKSTSDAERREKDAASEIGNRDLVRCFLLASAAAARKSGFPYKLYINELDRVFSSRRPDGWAGLYYRCHVSGTREDWNTNVLCLAFAYRMDIYIEEEFKRNREGILGRDQRPLMCYIFDGTVIDSTATSNSDCSPAPKILETLLRNGADPNELFQEATPWTLALGNGTLFSCNIKDLHMIQRLLEHGANPTHHVYLDSTDMFDDNDNFPQTPVYTTTFHMILSYIRDVWWDIEDQLEIIRLLLRYCQDFDAENSDGTTISAWADVLDERHTKKNRTGGMLGKLVREEIAAIKRQQVHALWI